MTSISRLLTEQQENPLPALKNNSKFWDTKFVIGNGSNQRVFHGIRCIVGSVSDPLFSMLYGRYQESDCTTIRIGDISPDAFEWLLNYCHLLDPVLTPSNIAEITHLADKYLILPLRDACVRYLEQESLPASLQNIDTENLDNFVNILVTLCKYSLHDVVEKLLRSERLNFAKRLRKDQYWYILTHPQLHLLPPRTVCLMLFGPELRLYDKLVIANVWNILRRYCELQLTRVQQQHLQHVQHVQHVQTGSNQKNLENSDFSNDASENDIDMEMGLDAMEPEDLQRFEHLDVMRDQMDSTDLTLGGQQAGQECTRWEEVFATCFWSDLKACLGDTHYNFLMRCADDTTHAFLMSLNEKNLQLQQLQQLSQLPAMRRNVCNDVDVIDFSVFNSDLTCVSAAAASGDIVCIRPNYLKTKSVGWTAVSCGQALVRGRHKWSIRYMASGQATNIVVGICSENENIAGSKNHYWKRVSSERLNHGMFGNMYGFASLFMENCVIGDDWERRRHLDETQGWKSGEIMELTLDCDAGILQMRKVGMGGNARLFAMEEHVETGVGYFPTLWWLSVPNEHQFEVIVHT